MARICARGVVCAGTSMAGAGGGGGRSNTLTTTRVACHSPPARSMSVLVAMPMAEYRK